MSIDINFKNKPKILGLDISTKTIGFALFDMTGSKLLELTHFSPKIKPQPEDKIEELIKNQRSPMIWVKRNHVIQKGFIVWW